MTRIRLAVVFVLSALFSFPISAAEGWMLYTEVDEMEDKEEVYPLYSRQLRSMSFQVKMRCLINVPAPTDIVGLLTGTSLESLTLGEGELRLDVATFNGYLAPTRHWIIEIVGSEARVDLGDGNVTNIFLARSQQWGNLYQKNISIEPTDGYRFKLELVADDGAKHIVKGDDVLGSFVSSCKEQQKQHMEMHARQQQERQEASIQAQTETARIEDKEKRADEYIAWIGSIQSQVARNWNRPPSARPGLECEVRVELFPGMQVVSAEILRCNGDDAVRRSIVAAIERASPLPRPSDPAIFERHVIFIFKPEQ